MTGSDLDAPRAEGKIGVATQRLVGRYPFHCAVIEQFEPQERPSVGTMAVTAASDSILLLYNASFVLNTPVAQLVGVLLHEVHHVIFGHLYADPADYPDRWATPLRRPNPRGSTGV